MTPKSSTLIGLSLSSCIQDLVKRKIAYSHVIKIIAGTAADGDEKWDLLLQEYKKDYWSDWYLRQESDWPKLTARALNLANRLRSEGKIEQPRLTTGMAPSWHGQKGRWVRSESEIKWWNTNEE